MKLRKRETRRFFQWMNERHAIYLRRAAGEPWPWTDDPILRDYKFTNVFRELDRTTRALRRRIDCKPISREPAHLRFYRIVLFRAFNWPNTYDRINKAGALWRLGKMLRVLRKMDRDGEKIFTGAYIVTNAGSDRPKLELVAEAVDEIRQSALSLFQEMVRERTLEHATRTLARQPMHGPFTAYEVACDMRNQRDMLYDATDVLTWANTGPGARRGVSRLLYGEVGRRPSASDCLTVMRELHAIATAGGEWNYVDKWPLEMREIEHSLCEFDKYERARLCEGRPRSRYSPPKE